MLQVHDKDCLVLITGYKDMNLDMCKNFLRPLWVGDYMKLIEHGFPIPLEYYDAVADRPVSEMREIVYFNLQPRPQESSVEVVRVL